MTSRFNALRLVAFAAVSLILALASASSATAADPTWSVAEVPSSGGQFVSPLGTPNDLSCWSQNNCLLSTGGNAAFPNGLFQYDGVQWRQLATVCGAVGSEYGRIIWAAPDEFWTITYPSSPRGAPGAGEGLALCHFKGGTVIGSYSKPASDGDTWSKINSGACLSANDCWFGGTGWNSETARTLSSPDGARFGAFHLHWNGSTVATFYHGQGRAAASIATLDNKFIETTVVGPGRNIAAAPYLAEPEPSPRQVYDIAAGYTGSGDDPFSADAFTPSAPAGFTSSATDLTASDADSQQLWMIGVGSTSGPGADPNTPVARGPYIARITVAGGTEPALAAGSFSSSDILTDVAAVPGTTSAFATLLLGGDTSSDDAIVAEVTAAGAVTKTYAASGYGTAARIDCPATNDCWLATSKGWLLHYSDGVAPAPGSFPGLITRRPNEATEQGISDDNPVDDSQLFAPLSEENTGDVVVAPLKTVKSAVRSVKSKLVGKKLVIRFVVVRKARVAIYARRKGRVVASAKSKLLKPGKHSLAMQLNVKRWPTKISMSVSEPK